MSKRWSLFGVLCSLSISMLPVAASLPEIQSFHEEAGSLSFKEVSRFYNDFYRNPPYFYDASEADWDRYVRSYLNEPESICYLAIQDGTIVGVIIGTPLAKASQKYKAAFMDLTSDLNSLYFLGELAINPKYTQMGIEQKLYKEFERQVQEKKRFSGICTWLPQSGDDQSAENFFKNDVGFIRSDISFEELWKDTFGNEKTPHAMVCWRKQLENSRSDLE